MKKIITVIVVSILLMSCGMSKEEQMLYDYENENIKKLLKVNLNDLDFNIVSIEKDGNITSKDSAEIYKDKLAELFMGTNFDRKKRDTLTFDYVINYADTIKNTYQKIILGNIKIGKKYLNYEYKKKRSDAVDVYVKANSFKEKFDSYNNTPEIILSTKYKATYKVKNPMLNDIVQTNTKYYFSNSDNTTFISSKSIE